MSRRENRADEFRARDKKVNKMTHDGLVEQNKATGQERRISQRLADVSFNQARPQAADTERGQPQKQRRKQANPADFLEKSEAPQGTQRFPDTVENTPIPPMESMRDAGDKPMERAAVQDDAPPPRGKKRPIPLRGGKRKPDAAADAEKPADPQAPPAEAKGRLNFEHGNRPQAQSSRKTGQPRPTRDGEPAAGNGQAHLKNRAARGKAEYAAKPEAAPQLHYDKSESTVEERAAAPPGAATAPGATDTADPESGISRQTRRYDKAQGRVQTTGEKLEKAKEKLPIKRRMRLEKKYDSASGKVKRRLQFETEVIPQGYGGPPLKRAGNAIAKGGAAAAVLKAHQKMHQVEQQNVALEAAHKTEFAAERLTGRAVRRLYRHHKNAPYQRVAKWERKQTQVQVNAAYQQALREHPELQRKTFAKWIQKQKIKRKYAQAAHEAKKTAQHAQRTVTAAGQIARAVAQFVSAHKSALLVVALLALAIVLFSAGLSSCTAMLTGVQSSVIASCYVAEEQDMNESELLYTELETELQIDISHTERDHLGFDEYRYNIGEIGHNPYELMGYLSAAYDIFTFSQVEGEIRRLFGEQYTLTRVKIVEIRTYTDEDGEEHEYEWYVLQTTLAVKPLSDIIQSSLPPGEQADRYDVYMLTYGNRQAFGSPFSIPWMAYISSPYGYRIHPISGEKNLHRGVDIAMAGGTPIQAIQDGTVVSAGDAGEFGLCVVIEDDRGYQSRYAHCSSLSVGAGQTVKKGDVIAAVGSTGNSTGNHLHLEVKHNGAYLNPYYFVDTGTSGPVGTPGTPGGPEIPDDPGAPMEDRTFEAMLAEAEKYLGYRYVWGGSSPATSFDCSGFVSWVVNHSGWDVGRLGAQALFNTCTPVSAAEAKPGDLIFFTKTFSCSTPVSHVGIYVGGERMIHCGDPISYANINSNYWQEHFYSYGRLP